MTNAKYQIVLYWSETDQAFLLEVPELSGCMADSTTHQDAVGNALTVIQQWLETAQSLGREISTPKGKLSYA